MGSEQEKLKATLKEILDEKLDEKLAPLIRSVEFLSAQFDDLKAQSTKLEDSNKLLQKDNECLKKNIARLNKELKDQTIAINNQEQYSRRECIEIRGIPMSPDENTDEIVREVGKLVSVEIGETDISVSHRIPIRSTGSGAPPPAIIAKFVRRDVRDKLYKARSKLKHHSTADLGLGRFSENPIYISESLTQRNKEIFKLTLQFKKQNHYKFIWTRAGNIYLRKNEESPPKLITSPDDLSKLGQHPGNPEA